VRVHEVRWSGGLGAHRGERVVDLRDRYTGEPMPLSVLVGSNGSGKTTALRLIQALAFGATEGGPTWSRTDLLAPLKQVSCSGRFPLAGEPCDVRPYTHPMLGGLVSTFNGRGPDRRPPDISPPSWEHTGEHGTLFFPIWSGSLEQEGAASPSPTASAPCISS
jgi:energy-coupling factor transporter ATP-binding protein EcfA2